jgi:eukaryotic-like serine/threonine-protein kinase
VPSASQSSRVLTLVFTDLVGSTSLKAEKGDDVAGELIAHHRDHVNRLSQANHGRIIDWAGDGCFLTFETPSTAVRFAVDLQAVHASETQLPKVYVGINMGEVVEKTGPGGESGPPRVEGLAVDIASRIQSLALPGQILMSGAVFNSARPRLNVQEIDARITWQAHGAYFFKDLNEHIQIGEVGITGVSPLKAPVASKKVQRAMTIVEEDTLGWRPAPGLEIPGRRNWVLESQLGIGAVGEVWLGTNINSRVKRVYKFCFEPERIRSIKGEVVLLDLLKERLGDREDIGRVIDWELTNPPCYIETEYTESGDLKTWAASKGGIDKVLIETRLELVAQTGVALSAALSAGVLHKDIKPSNILISKTKGGDSPRATLTDFGIGLLIDAEDLKEKRIKATGLSQTLIEGKSTSTSGTPLYMAPELLEGKPASAQSDIYSLGVLLYQMVIGDLSRALAIGWEQDVGDELLREDIAACVSRSPEKRLPDPARLSERLRSIDERRRFRNAELQAIKAEEESLRRRQRVKRVSLYSGVGIAVLAIIAIVGVIMQKKSLLESERTWAYQTAIPEVKRLLEAENFVAAYSLARKAEQVIPNDPSLKQYIEKSSSVIDIRTTPPGASVSYKPYTDIEGVYTELGLTPISGVRLPIGMHRWQIRKEGYQEREVVWDVPSLDWFTAKELEQHKPLFGDPYLLQLSLYEENLIPKGAIAVDRGRFIMTLEGIPPDFNGLELDHFFIDRTEVTNRAYKEFMDADGYSKPEFWKQEFKKDGQVIPWLEAMKAFVDRTGEPGPSTWESGVYPEGQEDYPVSGVSWFEAAAYAEFRGKNLPTIYHWARAAFPQREVRRPLSPFILPLSNFGKAGPVKVGTYPSIGSSGAKDMAGNVREWCWNAAGDRRYSLGGMSKDPSYAFTQGLVLSPWDRSPGNGFRCAVYPPGSSVASKLFQGINLAFHDPYSIPPLSEEGLRIYRSMYSYQATPLHPVLEAKDETRREWKRETVTVDAAYGRERVIIHLYLPTSGTPPYKAVIYFPGVDALNRRVFDLGSWLVPWDCIPKSGRAFIFPVYRGMYERALGTPGEQAKGFEELFPDWVKDMGKTIDYLETREDINIQNLAYMGLSLGARLAPDFSVYEERIKTLVLFGGGIRYPAARPKPQGLTFSYVKIPVLMLNGKFDYVFPVETHQKPFYDLLGTPPEHKRHILYDAGHTPFPRAECIRDLLDWLERYQGPSNSRSNRP